MKKSIKKTEHTGLRPKVGIITSITICFIEMLSAYLTASQKGQSQLTDVQTTLENHSTLV